MKSFISIMAWFKMSCCGWWPVAFLLLTFIRSTPGNVHSTIGVVKDALSSSRTLLISPVSPSIMSACVLKGNETIPSFFEVTEQIPAIMYTHV